MSITYIYDIHIQYLAHTSLCSCTKFLCVLHFYVSCPPYLLGNPKHKYCVGGELIKGSLEVKDLGVLVHKS